MKKLYWRPAGTSRMALALVALVSLASLAVVHVFPIQQKQPRYEEKLAAAQLTKRCLQALKEERQRRGLYIDPEVDPNGSGIIGPGVTPITSNTGHLEAKQLSTNPNYAALIVHLLDDAQVGKGDLVAVGLSGSFPALNVATLCALQVLDARAIVITSASGSEWGAVEPSFTWLDMEQALRDEQLISYRTVAGSRGGVDDRGVGLSKEGRQLVDAALLRHGVKRIDPKSLTDSIEQRMEVYRLEASGKPFKAYINVGGGAASVGTAVGKKLFDPGLNTRIPPRATDSVMRRFVADGVPVVHLTSLRELAEAHKLSTDVSRPFVIGSGAVYVKQQPDPRLVALGIALIVGALLGFVRLDLDVRLLGARSAASGGKRPEPQHMI